MELEHEQFKQTARAIESQFPTFYQKSVLSQTSILSQAWFLRLSEVSGIPLPDKKPESWLDKHERSRVIQQVVDCLAASAHPFTLVFPPGAIAVLRVYGAENIDEARAYALSILPNAAYEVRDGDETGGHAEPFHAWISVGAQGRMRQSQRLSTLTDGELERMCGEIEAVIDTLSKMDQGGQVWGLQFHEAHDLGEMLELEQIRRRLCRT